MLLSLLLQKDVIFDGQTVGKLSGVCWQKGSPCYLLITDKVFSADKIKAKANLLATNLRQVDLPTPMLPLGKSVYSTDGKLLGQIADIEVGSTLKLKSLVLDNNAKIALSKIVANNDIVTVRTNKPKAKLTSTTSQDINTPLQKAAGTATDLTAQQLVVDDTSANNKGANYKTTTLGQVQLAPQTSTTAQLSPKRKSGDFSFLVGKVVDKNIFNFLGELMIREGDIVTRQVYLQARAFGKLTELCLHTK